MMLILSRDFKDQDLLSAVHTCDGQDISPELHWQNPPENTKSFALIVDDPDAPDPQAPKMVWVHWILYNLPPNCRQLSQGVQDLPSGTQQGLNDWQQTGYRGPCPPIGQHRYFHKLYALDCMLPPFTQPPTKAELLAAMQGHILEECELVGLYEHPA